MLQRGTTLREPVSNLRYVVFRLRKFLHFFYVSLILIALPVNKFECTLNKKVNSNITSGFFSKASIYQ